MVSFEMSYLIIFIGIFLIYTALIRLGWYSILRMDKGSKHFYASVLIHCGICCLTALALALRETKTRKPSIFKRFTGLFLCCRFLQFADPTTPPPIPSNGFPRSSQLSYIRFCCGFPPKVATCALSECCCALCWTSCPWLSSLYGLNGKPFLHSPCTSTPSLLSMPSLDANSRCIRFFRLLYSLLYIQRSLPALHRYKSACFRVFGQCRNKHICRKVSVIHRFSFCFIRKYCLLFCCRRFLCCGFFLFFRNCPTFCKTNRQIAESIIWWRAMHKTILNAWLCLPCEFLRIRTSHKLLSSV